MRLFAGLILSMAVAAVSPAQEVKDAGSLAHFQSGGGWSTTFFVFNTTPFNAQAQLNFYQNDGTPVAIPLKIDQQVTASPATPEYSRSMAPGTVLTVKTDSTDATGITGWAKLQTSNSSVTGYLIFRYAGLDGSGVQEAVVTPETRAGTSYVLGFDNTNGHFSAIALANVTNQAVNVSVTARDALTGVVLGTTILALPAMGHQAHQLTDILGSTKLAIGTVEFSTPVGGQISVLGLRFTPMGNQTGTPTYAFTSTPPILKQ